MFIMLSIICMNICFRLLTMKYGDPEICWINLKLVATSKKHVNITTEEFPQQTSK